MVERAFAARLAAAARTTWPPAPARLLLLTGQSRLDASPLSPQQRAFLAALATPGLDIVARGFPFDAACDAPPAPILHASLRNARQYLWARRRDFGALVANALSGVLANTDRAIIVTGSNGLALLNAALAAAPEMKRPPLAVLALGPAGAPPNAPALTFAAVQSKRDPWSGALYNGPVAFRPTCGHLGYWSDEPTRAFARAFVAEALA